MNAPLEGNRVLLCQTIATVHAESGDSGAPVFAVTDSPAVRDVDLLGMMWGITTSTPVEIWISPVGGIYRDLGIYDAWDSCDPYFDC